MAAQSTQPAHDELHPAVYRAMVGLTLWLVLSVWVFFNSGAYVGLIFTVVTAFFLIFVTIPTALWPSWRRNTDEPKDMPEKFRDWLGCEFTTWTGGISGRQAATQILLPIAAVCIGMTVFGLVFYLDVPRPGY